MRAETVDIGTISGLCSGQEVWLQQSDFSELGEGGGRGANLC